MSFGLTTNRPGVDYFSAMQRARDATGLQLELARTDIVEGDLGFRLSVARFHRIRAPMFVVLTSTILKARLYLGGL